MTEYCKAIDSRCSRRKYLKIPLDQDAGCILRKNMARYNEESGLCIQLIEDDDKFKSSGMFSGVLHYFALIGKKNDPDLLIKAGYYGEKLVLDATLLSLGTCWVMGSYNKGICEEKVGLKEQDQLVCIITVGGVADRKSWNEELVNHLVKRKSKEVGEMLLTQGEIPGWVNSGIEAVRKGPSAMNRQPVTFTYQNKTVTAAVSNINNWGVDLGIALLHFEVGAGGSARFIRVGDSYQIAGKNKEKVELSYAW